MKCKWAAYAAVIAAVGGLGMESARATAIFVPNFSFEGPAVPNVSPYASPLIDSWTKEGNTFSTGEFYNTTDVPPIVDNATGNQLGFIFAALGVGLLQDLPDTYTVGQSYALTVAIQGGGGGMPLNTPLQFNLYYRNGSSTEVPIASAVYKNNNASGAISHLGDLTVNLPAVQSTDAWAGKAIGIEMVAIDDPNVIEGGYFDLDNVRLNAVPEPAGLGLLGIGVAALLRRRVHGV